MKVKELIKELEKCNPESDLICYSYGDKDEVFMKGETLIQQFCDVTFKGYDSEDIKSNLDFGYNVRESKQNSYVYLDIKA